MARDPDVDLKENVDQPSHEAIIDRIRAELCEGWINRPVHSWGPSPKHGGTGFVQSWTDTISKNIQSVRHYITCEGSHRQKPCQGRWSRRARGSLSPGVYCVFGSWVAYNGSIITELQDTSTGGRSLKRLRSLWAEHVLQPHDEQISASPASRPLLSEAEFEEMYEMLGKAIERSTATKHENVKHKIVGKGQGGWDGIVDGGVVMKRDTGRGVLGGYRDRCDQEPGGYFRIGDLEVWASWPGWSGMSIRDGRFRPGYHLEVLLGLMTTVVDYFASRELWRDRDIPWAVGTEWAWKDTPHDVSMLFADGLKTDVKEMFRREIERLQIITPQAYKADDGCSRQAQYPLLLDRAGETVSRHLSGEPLSSARGYIHMWILCATNDIQDYERDVLSGETNNVVRGLNSDQQVVDAAYTVLLVMERAIEHDDFDVSDLMLGTFSWSLQYWRYNTSRQFATYAAESVRSHGFTRPFQISELLDLAQTHYPSSQNWLDSYGMLYDRLEARVKALYWGCTCDSKPEGHDNWELLAESLSGVLNEDLEERTLLSLLALCIGASHGDIRCECAMDLSSYIGFVRFFHPDTGLVPRMHYRTSTLEGNSLAE